MLGLAVAVVGGPACLRVRYPDGAPSLRGERRREGDGSSHVGASLRSALGDKRLWLLGAGWFLTGLVFMMVTVHCVPFARDRGMPLEQAFFLLTAYGIGSAAGRLASGMVADRFGTAVTMYACVAVQALALAVVLGGPPAWGLTVALVAFGAGAAGSDNAVVKIIPDVSGWPRWPAS